MKRSFPLAVAAASFILSQPTIAAKPNIVFILADDMGYADCGVQGCTDFATPHIDSIARNGVRFTNGYVSAPVCSPSRAGLLTGRYQQRFGHELNLGDGRSRDPVLGLPVSETTLAQRLKDAGYATGLVGKWHLGSLPQFHPNARGFDEFFGFLMGQHGYFPGPPAERESPIERNGRIIETKKYLTEEFADVAVDFIERNHERPFFLYLAFNAPHVPLQAAEKDLARVPHLTGNRKTYAAMMLSLDDAVGRVLAKLREHRIESETLIAFLSDNGGPPGNGSGNGALRGHKAVTYEGGIRVPFFLRWSAALTAGKVDDRPVIALDLAPTALAAAGIDPQPQWKFDGVNLLPFLNGEKSARPHDALYWRFGHLMAVRRGDAKLVRAGSPAEELFDLATDAGERRNLFADSAQQASELEEAWRRWSAELTKPLWGDPDRARASKSKR